MPDGEAGRAFESARHRPLHQDGKTGFGFRPPDGFPSLRAGSIQIGKIVLGILKLDDHQPVLPRLHSHPSPRSRHARLLGRAQRKYKASTLLSTCNRDSVQAPMRVLRMCWLVAAMATVLPALAAAQSSLSGAVFHITRAAGPIRIDGDLSDEAWRTAARIEKWYEVSPATIRSRRSRASAILTYDDRFLYVAFEFDDPSRPGSARRSATTTASTATAWTSAASSSIRSTPDGRRSSSSSRPRNVQYDAVTDDASGENASPDFFWDSAARINDRRLDRSRCAFRSRRLRYSNVDPQTWGIIMFRNYPRQFRYQILSAPIPRGSNCTICRENAPGRARAPAGRRAPRRGAVHQRRARPNIPAAIVLGQPLVGEPAAAHVGLDVKYTPNAEQRDRRHRQARLLAGRVRHRADLGQRALRAVLPGEAAVFPRRRRSVPDADPGGLHPHDHVADVGCARHRQGRRHSAIPRWSRKTRAAAASILPGANGSSTAPQEFASTVFVGRAKRDIGLSFVGGLIADREATRRRRRTTASSVPISSGGRRRPTSSTGQWLYSETRTPDRPDLADEWNGQPLRGSALQTSWTHNTRHLDCDGEVQRRQPRLPRRHRLRAAGRLSRSDSVDRLDGAPERPRLARAHVRQRRLPGGAVGRGDHPRRRARDRHGHARGTASCSSATSTTAPAPASAGDRAPAVRLHRAVQPVAHGGALSVDATLGQDIDFDNARPARGPTINASVTLQPTDHLALDLIENMRSLNVNVAARRRRARLFTQQVSRVKGTYTFTSRLFVRVIGQYVATDERSVALRGSASTRASGDFGGSALFAYKINWQSVMFVGYGDDRELQRRAPPPAARSSALRQALVRVPALSAENPRSQWFPSATPWPSRHICCKMQQLLSTLIAKENADAIHYCERR